MYSACRDAHRHPHRGPSLSARGDPPRRGKIRDRKTPRPPGDGHGHRENSHHNGPDLDSFLRSCSCRRNPDTTPLGLGRGGGIEPRVGRRTSGQPWAIGQNPVGIQCVDRTVGSGIVNRQTVPSPMASERFHPQRGYVPQPRVGARNEHLPWTRETVSANLQPQRGCVRCGRCPSAGHNPVGVEPRLWYRSQGRPSYLRPTLGFGQNPVGIQCVDRTVGFNASIVPLACNAQSFGWGLPDRNRD